MTSIACFLLEPTDQARRMLRRYSGASDCSSGYCSASVAIGDEPIASGSNGSGSQPTEDEKADPRWPAACACGRAFKPTDYWQVNVERLWKRTDTGELHLLDQAPPGAMYFASWYEPAGVGPDGKHLVVVTPGGHWLVDQDRHRWQRTGEAPKITASPSILFHGSPGYHGHLIDGQLVEC